MDEASLNQKLWFEYLSQGTWPSEFPRLWLMQYPKMPRGGAVFVGLNPSDSESAEFAVAAPEELLSIERIEAMTERERTFIYGGGGSTPYPYYRPFAELASPLGAWSYLDLLPVRDRTQAKVKAVLRLDDDEWNPLATEWMSLSIALLADLQPAAVVVVNALAADLLLRWFERTGTPAAFDEERAFTRSASLEVRLRACCREC